MVVQVVENYMSEHGPSTHGYQTERYGTGPAPGYDAIVAEWTDRAQRAVVDVNHDLSPDEPI